MTGRLILSLPLYTDVPVNWFVRFLSLDKAPVVDYIATRKQYLSSAMTKLFQQAIDFDYEWDRIVVLEADMMPRRDALVRIANYPDHLDIVGSLYHQHSYPHHPCVFEQVDENNYRTLAPNQIQHMTEQPGLYPVDGVGFGLVSVHRRVLEKWDKDVPLFASQVELLGHDLFFCRAAIQQGFSVHVDTVQQCGHLSEVQTTHQDYLDAITAARAAADNSGDNSPDDT